MELNKIYLNIKKKKNKLKIMEYENYIFLNKNKIQYQRPNFTINKLLKYNNQRGLSASSKNIF